MNLQWTKTFEKEYRALPSRIQQQADRKLTLLLQNPRHPSLRLKKMKGQQSGIWELSVTMNYRITFQVENDIYLLRRIGTHDVLGRP